MSQIEKVARAFPALWNLVQYHKSGGHSGSGSDRTLANALRELAAIAAMPVQSEPVAELRAEITRLTEALRAAEERADEGYQAAIADVVEWLRVQQHGRTSDNYPGYYARQIEQRFGKDA